MFSGHWDDLHRLITALTGDPARRTNRSQQNRTDGGQRAIGPPSIVTPVAGNGARAARRLRGQPMGGQMFILSVSDRGLIGASISADGDDDGFPFPFGAVSAEEAAFTGNAMRAMMEHVVQLVADRSMEEHRHPAVPPASEITRDALPSVVVTKEDLLDATNSKCSICLDEFQAGARATRIFCGHLFCTSCVREWLSTANSCPVCRFELTTDCEEYEVGRKERMRERVARLKEGELRTMRVPELRRMMTALGVSGDGCVEKAELISRLGASPGVEVAPDREDAFYDDADLENLELPLLRSLLERHRVPPLAGSTYDETSEPEEDKERENALRRFAASGLMGAERALASQKREEEKEEAGKDDSNSAVVGDDTEEMPQAGTSPVRPSRPNVAPTRVRPHVSGRRPSVTSQRSS